MSSSILVNASALTALQALNMTQQNLQTTETQVSTGLKISTAADNAAYWSIGTKMSSQNSALGAVTDALNESGSLLSTMTTALNSTLSIMTKIQNDLISAEQPGADTSSIQTDLQSQQAALLSIGESANFNGQNWLYTSSGTTGTVGLVASYDSASGVSTINIDTTSTLLFDNTAATLATTGILAASGAAYTAASILTLDISTLNQTGGITTGDIQNMLTDVQTAVSAITTASSTLGATTTNVTNQQTFITALSDSLTNGVASLVDADMNQASTRLSALQVQQQLGIQALSIANTNTQLILKLFQ
jgi:flagellin